MPRTKGGNGLEQKLRNVDELLVPSGSRRKNATRAPTPSPPPSPRRARQKNATRGHPRRPSPSPPLVEDDDEEHGGGEDKEEHEGGEHEEEHGGGDNKDEDGGEDEDYSEEEGLGGLPFERDPTLAWQPPAEEEYVATEERLQPREKKPYQRGKTKLPKLRVWPYSDVVLVPAGKSMFKYGDPTRKPGRGYANILGGLIRECFPGLVDLPSGGQDVAWTWKHYSYALDPRGKHETMQQVVVHHFWKYFTRAEGKEHVCDDILHRLCRKRVTGMHYEARIQCVRNWHAERRVWMTKDDARDTLMAPWQYMQKPPQYVGKDTRCFLAMVMWWTCRKYLEKHEEGKLKRAEMRGGSHIQGSIPLSLHMQQEEIKTGVVPNIFGLIRKMKTRKTPHPETGSMWVSGLAETRCTTYESKYKQKHGEEKDPSTEDFDVEVAVLAGQGKKHGQLWTGDGCVDPMIVPSLRQVRSGRTSDQPRVETRPRALDLAVERLRAEMEQQRQQAEERHAKLEQELRDNQAMQQQMHQQMQQQQQMMSYLMQQQRQMQLTSPAGTSAPTTCPPFAFNWAAPDPNMLALLQQPPGQNPVTPHTTVNNLGIIRNLTQFQPGPRDGQEQG